MAAIEATKEEAIDRIGDAFPRFQRISRIESTLKDTEDLPKAFPVVAKKLPLLPKIFTSINSHRQGIEDTTETAKDLEAFHKIKQSTDVGSTHCSSGTTRQAMRQYDWYCGLVGDVVVKVAAVGWINQEVDRAAGAWGTSHCLSGTAQKTARYVALVEQNDGQGLEKLMEDMLNQMIDVAKPTFVAEELVIELNEALAEVKKLPRSLAKKQGGGSIVLNNYGDGVQFQHSGTGSQNHSTGGLMVTGQNSWRNIQSWESLRAWRDEGSEEHACDIRMRR
ncbi:hypothetical protein BDP81DRAFT_402318 [Colletotrichum phormii]|uniref:NACHT-NTPase and P-loop NTPases N-terminal domain-containing protein n=1 Tax=Colletotrichum phormii TaxID=359342 RepID=A0AAJ0A0D1_9PEZI|nr:uncharacterized protein BDP81DRAFT_402318 [Colletotrichum phormii]KAK1654114.1 hypothetical protein BDP81DRAFT_402318 [Colletotrichum phormii]